MLENGSRLLKTGERLLFHPVCQRALKGMEKGFCVDAAAVVNGVGGMFKVSEL